MLRDFPLVDGLEAVIDFKSGLLLLSEYKFEEEAFSLFFRFAFFFAFLLIW